MEMHKRKLLIVDDEPGTRLLLSQIFTGLGHEVCCAEDGIAALQRMRDWMPEIILSDLNMPGMSGFELLSVVRRRLPEIYVIATSGAYSGDGVPDGVAADAFYEKASGLAALFRIFKAAEAKAASLRPSVPRSPLPVVPIWISVGLREDRSIASSDGLVAIGCPDCLRVFTYSLLGDAGVVHHENCIYCGSRIHYAIVRVLAPVSEMRYHAVLGAQMAAGGGGEASG